jgi:CHAT domain-containing protein
VLPLGRAAAIDSLVARWRQQAATEPRNVLDRQRAEANYFRAGEALRRRVWDPLAASLVGIDRVFLVPDGALNLVSFGTLPVASSTYLVERGPLLHYLSAERDLVPVESEARTGSGLMVLGGADFNRNASTRGITVDASSPSAPDNSSSTRGTYRSPTSDCDDFVRMRFEPLPSSRHEVDEIAALWGARASDPAFHDAGAVLPLFGAAASELAFKQQATSKRVLHLATHAFFIDEECRSTPAGAKGRQRSPRLDRPSVTSENPLLLSGLALAGANARGKAGHDTEDGILTSEEIAALDLSSVDWVVLSACNTGLGVVRTGEGVFGLRRAFAVAGARSLVMSLWKVEDRSARSWMKALYEARFGKPPTFRAEPTAEAVRDASLALLERRRKLGESTHPASWGAFIATGDWR